MIQNSVLGRDGACKNCWVIAGRARNSGDVKRRGMMGNATTAVPPYWINGPDRLSLYCSRAAS
jgi:hypothetical protein